MKISILARVEKNCPLFKKSEFTNWKRVHKKWFWEFLIIQIKVIDSLSECWFYDPVLLPLHMAGRFAISAKFFSTVQLLCIRFNIDKQSLPLCLPWRLNKSVIPGRPWWIMLKFTLQSPARSDQLGMFKKWFRKCRKEFKRSKNCQRLSASSLSV